MVTQKQPKTECENELKNERKKWKGKGKFDCFKDLKKPIFAFSEYHTEYIANYS